MKIAIDLRNLTPEIMKQCDPQLGKCDYAAPCVIGALMTPTERFFVAGLAEGSDEDDVEYFLEQGVFDIPADQVADAMNIQCFFDSSDWDGVMKIASRYMRMPYP